jgi:hypothetical protein
MTAHQNRPRPRRRSRPRILASGMMWLRKCGQVVRSYRILCPEGPARNASRSDAGGDYRTEPGVSTPGHIDNRAPPCLSAVVLGMRDEGGKGRQKFVEDLVQHPGRKTLLYRHLQGGCPFYPYPGLKPRAESCSPRPHRYAKRCGPGLRDKIRILGTKIDLNTLSAKSGPLQSVGVKEFCALSALHAATRWLEALKRFSRSGIRYVWVRGSLATVVASCFRKK